MTQVVRLLTLAETDDGPGLSVGLRHLAVLDDGRQVLLLDDRGFSSWASDGGDPWRHATAEDLEDDARTCVGPDEPDEGSTHEQEAAAHFAVLAARLGDAGVSISAEELAALPHDVELGEGIRRRLG